MCWAPRSAVIWRLARHSRSLRRGVPILAEVCGYGFSSNGGGISQPSDDGSVTAIRRALEAASMQPDEIDYVIPGNDDAIRAIKLISGVMANAIQEGKQGADAAEAEAEAADEKAPVEG